MKVIINAYTLTREVARMIIDADTHVAKGADDRFSIESHLETMEDAGVDRTLTWLSPHHYVGTGIEEHNRHIYECTKRYPDRIIGFGWTDPNNGIEHARAMVRACSEEYGFCGIKMNGAQNDYYIDDPDLALPVVEEIAKSGKAIAFHIGPDAYEKTHPFRAGRIAEMFPEMNILMVHMGMTDQGMNRAVIETAERHPNMYLIGSATTDEAVLSAIRRLGPERVCFGSDSPFRRMKVIRAMYEAALSDRIPADAMALVMGGNIERLFDL